MKMWLQQSKALHILKLFPCRCNILITRPMSHFEGIYVGKDCDGAGASDKESQETLQVNFAWCRDQDQTVTRGPSWWWQSPGASWPSWWESPGASSSHLSSSATLTGASSSDPAPPGEERMTRVRDWKRKTSSTEFWIRTFTMPGYDQRPWTQWTDPPISWSTWWLGALTRLTTWKWNIATKLPSDNNGMMIDLSLEANSALEWKV